LYTVKGKKTINILHLQHRIGNTVNMATKTGTEYGMGKQLSVTLHADHIKHTVSKCGLKPYFARVPKTKFELEPYFARALKTKFVLNPYL
jgi:hypothetical protein